MHMNVMGVPVMFLGVMRVLLMAMTELIVTGGMLVPVPGCVVPFVRIRFFGMPVMFVVSVTVGAAATMLGRRFRRHRLVLPIG
jgi:hypothetical protein